MSWHALPVPTTHPWTAVSGPGVSCTKRWTLLFDADVKPHNVATSAIHSSGRSNSTSTFIVYLDIRVSSSLNSSPLACRHTVTRILTFATQMKLVADIAPGCDTACWYSSRPMILSPCGYGGPRQD